MAKADHLRVNWVDYAKGIGIFLVVLGHVLRGLQASQILVDGPAFRFIDAAIYSFHMPLFFLLSGLFANRQVERDPGGFIRDRLATIAYPYLIWSVLQTVMQCALGRHTNHSVSLHDLADIAFEPIMQFWFLYALFLISLIAYFLGRVGLGPPGVLAAFVMFWASQGQISLLDWSPLREVRRNGLYYAFGSVLYRYGWVGRIERSPAALMVLATLLGYGAVGAWASRFRAAMHLSTLTVALALCGIEASVALACLLSRSRGTVIVRLLGLYSLEIYVAHTIASAGIRMILQKVFRVQDATLHIVLGTLGGVVLPLILGWFCRQCHAEFLFRFPRIRGESRSISGS